ncbi:imidazole glycerol phosphate synthase subunit HisF [Streptococcus oricebi]|uniref:Imidazole glycerol phosphate synthase subunit HisF n=1 Tax=Streptococcus oricebi TaxID=1547447 RepID=A0ABS5B173_9STRE|nr:imidazole glycerol phosphate synthase subunit HisF [Streptococcus oricebi]MBP2622576.1 imidazole glycerol phosphate synthase subunit HisF [Streptococcus oricebi]
MLKKRIIPCLDVKDGRVVKGVNFVNLSDVGDPVQAAKAYYEAGCDELVFLDITATHEGRQTTLEMVRQVAEQVFIPFTVGGGISSVDQMNQMLKAGADKVAINSAALLDPSLISACAEKFGSQCVVLAVDAKKEADHSWHVYLAGGRKDTGRDLLDWVQEAVQLGAGEILLTSMDKDGTKSGFDLAMLQEVAQLVSVPLIASGGAGSSQDVVEVFEQTPATGALAASIFHYGQVSIAETKEAMKKAGLEVRINGDT